MVCTCTLNSGASLSRPLAPAGAGVEFRSDVSALLSQANKSVCDILRVGDLGPGGGRCEVEGERLGSLEISERAPDSRGETHGMEGVAGRAGAEGQETDQPPPHGAGLLPASVGQWGQEGVARY